MLAQLDQDTLLLRLPTFDPAAEAQINALLEANHQRLAGADTLIIDVRGNAGGSTHSFHGLRPLLYTGPMVTPGISHYATDDNIRALQAYLQDTAVTPGLRATIEALIASMREHRGGFVPVEEERFEMEPPAMAPRRVAVLADRLCVSSCETFIWIARQSARTTVFGERTAGFLDYGDALLVETPSPEFRVQVPSARSNRVLQGMPLDNVGIEPDVHIPDSVADWVDWVRRYLAASPRPPR